jgi:enoyl-CoA hydratase/carnithine racemase
MPADGLAVERHDGTLLVTIDHGDENLFSVEMVVELAREIRAGAADPELRFVRLRGQGEVFCLGREGAAPGAPRPEPRAIQAVASAIVDLNELLQTTPAVVVAEVQGDAAGLGAGLVGCADVAVAAESARFSFPEILAGYAATVVLGWLPHAVPRKRAFEMVATGTWVDADTAHRDGLITEVVPAARLAARVDERIAQLAAVDVSALRDIKKFLARTRAMDPPSAAAASIDSLALAVMGKGG